MLPAARSSGVIYLLELVFPLHLLPQTQFLQLSHGHLATQCSAHFFPQTKEFPILGQPAANAPADNPANQAAINKIETYFFTI